MNIFFLGLVCLILSGFVARIFKPKFFILSIINIFASILCAIPAFRVLANGQAIGQSFYFNNVFGNVNFQIDMLSAFFVIVISLMSALTTVYAKGYLKNYKDVNSHIIFLPILYSSMLAVVTCQHVLMFLISWEIMSLSSFFLVIFENEKKEVLRAGVKYLIFMHISVIFIMIAFAILSINANSFDFSMFNGVLNKHLADIVFALFFVGFGTKAGFVPFHNWLPDAHPQAPSHVSAIMSGVMIKTGIYGILRALMFTGTPSKYMSFVILTIALITALYGILYAIGQEDIKKLLAYSSIENIGIIGIGLAIGMIGMAYQYPLVAILGFAGCIMHILNHAIFKELLFMAAGSVYVKTHTKNMELLGGIIKSMPKTAFLFLVGAIAICALPPFNGFVSELLIYLGMFKGLALNNFVSTTVMIFSISCLALVGTMAVLCFSKVFSITFLGAPRGVEAKEDNGLSMIFPMAVLALFIVLIGIFPDIAFAFVLRAVSSILGNIQFSAAEFLDLFIVIKTVALYSLSFLVILAVAISVRFKLTGSKIKFHETWGCGYNKPSSKMQYTASSYVSPFLSMLKPLFKKIFDIEKPRKLFPKSSHFKLYIEDIEEAYIINPIVKYDEWFLSKFEALQNGNIQSYIKYGLIFLVIVLIGSLFI